MKQNISGTAESEFDDLDVNKVETALKSIGVQLRDATGQIRDFDQVIVDLGGKWDGLSRNAQRYVATIAAGSRQQSRLIALLDDFDRTIELMDTAAESEGKADEQFAKYADTMEYKLNRLTTEWEKFKTGIIEEDLFKNSIDSLTNFIKKINEIDLKNPFNIAEIGTGIALMVTGITKSITLMKTMISGTTTFISAIKKDIPQILSNKVKDYYIKKGSRIQVNLEPVVDRNLLNEELNRTRQYLQNLRADRALRVSMIPQMSITDQTLAEFQVSSTVSQKQRNANYENFLKFAKGTLSTREIDEFRLQLTLLKAEMEATSGKTVAMGDVFERYRQIVLQDANITNQQTRELEVLEAEIRRVEGEEGRLTGLIEENSNAAERNAGAIDRANAKMSKMEATSLRVQTVVAKFASGGLNLLTAGLSTAITYLPMIAMGMMDVETGLKMMGMQVGVMIIQQGLLTLANAASAASTKFLAKENEVAKRSYLELMKAELGALAPLYAFLAVAIAIAAAVGIAIYAYKKWAEAHDEVRIATERLKKEEEALKEIQEQRQKIKATKSETKKELEDTIALKKQWEELSLIKNKTTEQQEEENELIEKISSQYPEIITYHDTINNKLDLSISKWEKIIEKQKEVAQQAAKEDYLVAVAEATQQYQTKKAELGEKQARNSNLNGDIGRYSLDWNSFNFAKQEIGKRKDIYDSYSDIPTGSDTFINYLSSSWGFSKESLELFSKVEGYNLKTKEGVQKFLNGQELTLAEEIGFLKLWKDKVEQANDDIINYNKELVQAQKDYEEIKKTALNEYLYSIEDDAATILISAKNIERNKKKINYEDFYSNYSDNFTSSSDEKQTILTPGSYGDLTTEGQDVLKVFGIDSEEKFKKLDADILTEYIQSAIDVAQNEDLIIKSQELIGKSSYEYLSKIIDGSLDYTQKELRDKALQLRRGSEDAIDQSVSSVLYDIIQSDFTEINKKIKDIYGKTYGVNIEHNILKNFQIASQGFIDEFEEESTDAVEFLKNLGDFFDKNQISLEDRTPLINKDLWTSYNPLDEEAFREKVINNFSKSLDKTQEEIEKISDKWIQEGKNANIINENVSVGDIEAYSEKIIKIQEAFKDAGEELELFSEQGKKNIIIANDQLETYEKLISSLKEAGIQDAENLLNRDEATGKYIFNLEKANKIMQRYGVNAIDELKHVKEQADIQVVQLKSQENLNEEDAKTLLEQEAISEELEKQIPLIELAADKAKEYADAFNQAGGRLSFMSSLIKSVSGALSNFQKNKFLGQSDIVSLQEGFQPFGIDANQFINKSLGLSNPTSLYQTAISELKKSINSGIFNNEPDKLMQAKALIAELYNDWMDYLQDVEDEQEKAAENEEKRQEEIKKAQENVVKAEEEIKKAEEEVRKAEEDAEEARQKALDDIKKAEEDLVDIQKEYADQLEVIKEKQEAINEEIEKYNELLYGSENRKGKLDFFYNYEQAVSSLNDEISRTSELLGKSEDINESINALTRYTQATHSLIATEKAKQAQIQAGLSNYASMIENGTASYTNRETGQQILINFGDFAKKDQATGKYILDQRLLNQASFNDDYKDLIEENIETYNDYIDEYNKLTDEIEKTEEELQEKREQALKAYGDIEKNVADSLKTQYEKEVEDLKDKYNSMKEADDDYLTALEEALNKQKELREREDKYEELAEQEKKLSLLQRDTSGTRQLDVNKLKKDVEKTRKQLLDDAVNDVVDGLKKLAKENEETRQVEIQLRDAVIQNTAYWNRQAEAITPSFENATDYASYMAGLNPDFSSMTMVQQQTQIEEYKSQFAEALEYQSWNLLDATSQNGDAIVDIIDVSSDEIIKIMTEKTTSFSEEVIRSYDEVAAKVLEDLQNQEESIDDARDALQEAIDKLEEISQKAIEAADKIKELQDALTKVEEENLEKIKEKQTELEKTKAEYQESLLELEKTTATVAKEAAKELESSQRSQGIQDILSDVPSSSGIESGNNEKTMTTPTNILAEKYNGSEHTSVQGKTIGELVALYNDYQEQYKNNKSADTAVAMQNVRECIVDAIRDAGEKIDDNSISSINKFFQDKGIDASLKYKYADGGLVNFTGPAWVDGTPTAPEAFLSASDTKAIGAAARILSDLQIIKDYNSLGQIINNTTGDTSIEINLNIENLSSDIDIENMIERVKDEIVSVANPIGINAILNQR